MKETRIQERNQNPLQVGNWFIVVALIVNMMCLYIRLRDHHFRIQRPFPSQKVKYTLYSFIFIKISLHTLHL